MTTKFVLILFIGFLVSCSTTQNSEIKKSFTKTELVSKVNTPFTVTLKSNSSTGYSWKWVNKNEIKYIELLSNKYIDGVSKETEHMVGVPGKEVWIFKGSKSGNYELKMNYVGPGRSKVVAETKTIKITIK